MTKKMRGACHCGQIEFEVTLENGFENLRRCNCSLCKRKGVVMASVPVANLQVTKGAEIISVYTWNTGVARHFFCPICGIYTHHQRRSNPAEFGFNVACIDGVDPFSLGEIGLGNGAAQSLIK